MSKIYLAVPYSHSDSKIRESRFIASCIAAGHLINQGHFVYSPITHCHPIAVRCDLPKDFDFWRDYDLSMIDWADEICILPLDGWEESKGIRGEKEYASKQGKRVTVDMSLLDHCLMVMG